MEHSLASERVNFCDRVKQRKFSTDPRMNHHNTKMMGCAGGNTLFCYDTGTTSFTFFNLFFFHVLLLFHSSEK